MITIGLATTKVGIPFAVLTGAWSVDQAQTGLRELWTNEFKETLGSTLLKNAFGDGILGSAASFVYEAGPLPLSGIGPVRTALQRGAATVSRAANVFRMVPASVGKYIGGIHPLEGNRLADSIRRSLQVEGRNIGLAEIVIDGTDRQLLVAVSGRASPVGTVAAPAKPIFTTRASGAITRALDSEVKILEDVARSLPRGAKGRIRLFTERPPCRSCQGVIRQFREMFPDVELIITHGSR